MASIPGVKAILLGFRGIRVGFASFQAQEGASVTAQSGLPVLQE